MNQRQGYHPQTNMVKYLQVYVYGHITPMASIFILYAKFGTETIIILFGKLYTRCGTDDTVIIFDILYTQSGTGKTTIILGTHKNELCT